MNTKQKRLAKTPKDKELVAIGIAHTRAVSVFTWHPDQRTHAAIAAVFNTPPLADGVCTKADLERYKNECIKRVEEKYSTDRETEEGTSSSGGADIPDMGTAKQVETTYVAKYPRQKATLLTGYCAQQKAAQEIWDKIKAGKKGILFRAMTGSGKTYVNASIIRNFLEQKAYDERMTLHPVFYITKASIVPQTKSVIKDDFGIDTSMECIVQNIDALRSSWGKRFLREYVRVKNGEDSIAYEWNKYTKPPLFVWDECQALARAGESKQGDIAVAATETNAAHVMCSATPFSRICEGKAFACATKEMFPYGGGEVPITPETWNDFANWIAYPATPDEHNEAAMKRFMDFFRARGCVVEIKNIRPKHKVFNSVLRMHFANQQQQERYFKAWAKYQFERNKILEKPTSGGGGFMEILARLTIFRKEAEDIGAEFRADWANEQWTVHGKQPVLGMGFKRPITNVIRFLIQKHGWKRDDISVIWGGSSETLNIKQKLAKKFKEDPRFRELMLAEGLDLEELGIGATEVNVKSAEEEQWEKANRLATQSPAEREAERLRFQRGESRCLIFSFKSGGVGLSAHHEEQYPNARPRVTLFTPVYSEKELIQGCGRAHRITSISETHQWMCYYAGTVEAEVAEAVVHKLKSARVVSGGESWESLLTKCKNTEADEPEEDEVAEELEGSVLGEYVPEMAA